jgi:hypothetical protein
MAARTGSTSIGGMALQSSIESTGEGPAVVRDGRQP